MSAEDAFLASMGNGDPVVPVSTDPQVDDDEDDYDPSAPTAADAEDAMSSSVPTPQDPAITSQASSRPASTQPIKPSAIGGFVAEESDEDNSEMQAAGTTEADGVAIESLKSPSQAVPGSVSQTPVPNPAQSLQPPQEQLAPQSLTTNGAAQIPLTADSTMDGTTGETAAAPPVQASLPVVAPSALPTIPKSRLPNDIIGIFEDRIAEDPKGDVEAWMGLIAHLKSKGKFDEVRAVYGRFFEIFPTAAEQWVAYARMELELDDLPRLEAIFNLSLLKVQSIALWSIYLDHVRRRNDIATDTSGQGRQVVSQAYEFVINQVGQDRDSGPIWQDYIAFIKSGPGAPGGSHWQDSQKMDLLRKAYQRAVCVPMSAVSSLWKEYDTFEMGLNKMTGRKFLQEKSPSYMTARSSFTALQNLTRDLRRGVIPRLPPHPGFDGEEDFMAQVGIWQAWVAWEKEDPLVLKDEDASALQGRILFVYRQAVMSLRFWPPMWFEAAQWCYNSGLETDGDSFLDQGLEANPESCLLAFSKADKLEQKMPSEDGEDSMVKRGVAVRAPYNGVLDVLYQHLDIVTTRQNNDLGRIEERYAAMSPDSRDATPEAINGDNDDDEMAMARPLSKRARKEKEIQECKAETVLQTRLIMKTLTHVWIALMRAMRRIQGKGKPGEKIGGMRNIFKEARMRGRLTSDVYIATALMEHHCYREPAAPKIFNLGMKLFPEDENFALEHVKFLVSTGDPTNARAVFETTVSKLTANPANVPRARALFAYFHDWESKYGELSQATRIESRMAELYPTESALSLFTQRFGTSTIGPEPFDPCAVRILISPTQTRPKGSAMAGGVLPSIETTDPSGYVQSPKRPLEDSDAELPARKLLRGESPLKGAAGRRQAQRQAREGGGGGGGHVSTPSVPKPLPPAIFSLLSVIPPARQWDQTRFEPVKMTDLVGRVDLARARVNGAPVGGYGYGR